MGTYYKRLGYDVAPSTTACLVLEIAKAIKVSAEIRLASSFGG